MILMFRWRPPLFREHAHTGGRGRRFGVAECARTKRPNSGSLPPRPTSPSSSRPWASAGFLADRAQAILYETSNPSAGWPDTYNYADAVSGHHGGRRIR